jgi:serine/threonine-protein kinase
MLNKKGKDPSVDDLVMSAAALALASPVENREAYIHGACGGDPELIRQVRDYLDWEERMDGFLEESLFAHDEPPFQVGDLADGRFDILRDAGQGGMGWVYEGWDKQLNCRVAIKCSKAGFHKRLPPEVLHAREIAHRNVCKVFDIHTAQTRHREIEFISMEFLEGETLAARLARGRLSRKEALALARQICAGLAEAHRKGVVHGDVKSNNVILTKDVDGHERAVITDFGLARTPGTAGIRGTAQSMAGGAMDYIAPEVWNGGKATRASDVYGLGVILCELFAGHRPFGPDARIEQRFEGKPPAMQTKWDRVLARCLEPDPSRRFQSASEVVEAIEPQAWPRHAAAAAAVLLAAVGSIEINRYLSKEPVRLALEPIEASSADLTGFAGKLTRDVAAQLAKIKGGDRVRLSLIPPEKARAARNASNVLHVSLSRQGGKLFVHAQLTDARSKGRIRDWTPAYAPAEERYIPIALAGVVTEALKLPPLQVHQVNAAARKDYWDGVWYTRQNSTLDQALLSLRRAVQEDPDSPLTWAALAEAEWFQYRALIDETRLRRVRDSLRQAEERNPDVPAAHRVEGYLHWISGFYEKATPELERAITLQPGNSLAYIWLGKTYEGNGQLDQALAAYQKARDAEPNYFRPYQDLGAYYLQHADFSQGARYHKRAVELAPDEPNLHSNLAAAYMQLVQFKAAERELRRSIELRETPAADFDLGHTLMYEGDNPGAIHSFENALKFDSPPPGGKSLIYIYSGIAYRRLKQFDKAKDANLRGRDAAGREIAQNPRDGFVAASLGYFYAALGDRRASEYEITRAQGLSPDDAGLRWRAVLTYEELYRIFKDQSLRDETLKILRRSTAEELQNFNLWPDMSDLQKDRRFLELLHE